MFHDTVMDWFTDPENKGWLQAIGAAGQIASAESAVGRLEDMGKKAVTAIGMPAGKSIYDTVAGATQFKPFSVYSLPGSVTTTAQGGTTFDLSPEQRALEASLRTGGSTLIDAALGRGQYGTLDPATGQYQQNLRAGQSELMRLLEGGSLIDPATGQHEQTYRSSQQGDYLERFRDPFTAGELATSEQTLFDRLREIRMPEEERARVALQQQLVAGGRQGLQTAQFGGSPESFALNKAIEEQKSQDVISAMNFARQDAQLLSDANLRAVQEGRTDQSLQSQQRLAALQQQVQEKQLTGNLAEQMLASSYRPSQALLAQTQPSLNLADISTVAGRQLGGYGSELGRASLDYDLGSEGAAVNLRNQLLQGLFGMLTQSGQQQQQPGININFGGSGGSSGGGGMSWQDYATDVLGI
jgi:uncharacterized membrane protein YgcG